MKNIWLISYRFDEVMAGPSIRFQRYSSVFKRFGFQLHIVTARLNKSYPENQDYEDFSVHRISVPRGILSITRFVSKALIYISNQPQDNQRVLTFILQTYQLWLLPRLAKKGIKVFYVSTMAANPVFKGGAIGRLWNKLHLMLYSILYQRIGGVVCSTETLANTLVDFGLKDERKFIINNGVDTVKFAPPSQNEKKKLRELLGLPSDALLFLFIGLKTDRKGIRELCEAWIQVENTAANYNAHLLLVGNEKPEANNASFNDWWRSFKSAIHNDGNITLVGGVENVEDWFRASDVFVFPSKKEGMPNVVLEAMSTGLPIITNRFEGYSAVYGDEGVTHLAFSHREKSRELERLLCLLMEDENRRLNIGHEARKEILASFSVEESVKSFIDLFQD